MGDSLVAQTVKSACNVGNLGSIPESGRSPGEGNRNPLQYSCLENPTDGWVQQASVYWVAKSQTRLTDFSSTTKNHAWLRLCVGLSVWCSHSQWRGSHRPAQLTGGIIWKGSRQFWRWRPAHTRSGTARLPRVHRVPGTVGRVQDKSTRHRTCHEGPAMPLFTLVPSSSRLRGWPLGSYFENHEVLSLGLRADHWIM